MSNHAAAFSRAQASELLRRLLEPRRFLQVLAGPRQAGKTTLLPGATDSRGALLVLDEVQKVSGWSETVKRLWDADTRARRALKVVLLGSAPVLVQRGLTESLAGRFEVLHRLTGASRRCGRPSVGPSTSTSSTAPTPAPRRWRTSRTAGRATSATRCSREWTSRPCCDAFQLGCAYSGHVLSYTKMLGQLQEAGNTTTLANYLDLLAGAGMLTGLATVVTVKGLLGLLRSG